MPGTRVRGTLHTMRTTWRSSFLAGLVAALVLAGCGGDTKTVTERTVVVTAPTTATQSTPTTPTTSPTTTTKPASDRCPDIPDVGPTGADPADAVNVRVMYTDCTTAERLARRFYSVWIPSGKAPGEQVTVLGFRCGERPDAGGFAARVACNISASEVTFDLQ